MLTHLSTQVSAAGQTALDTGPRGWAVRALTADEEQRFVANEEAFRRAREEELAEEVDRAREQEMEEQMAALDAARERRRAEAKAEKSRPRPGARKKQTARKSCGMWGPPRQLAAAEAASLAAASHAAWGGPKSDDGSDDYSDEYIGGTDGYNSDDYFLGGFRYY